jgi:CheY-like chemotaxis protein
MANSSGTHALGKKVLIADDAEFFRSLLSKTLSAKGYTVLEAADGAQALSFLKSHEIDYMISDLDMPGGDGFSLLATIKSQDVKIPVLIVTGNEETTLSNYARFGVRDLLHKPFSPEMIERIFKFLSS